ncbi:hypothetical protein XA68_15999 [Ophiocordyceps unilateralis]|uniref:Autophagy-related protein 14 n=1 Tax=Ophiocordyceps unilateralis TaxID=268505 RepID=A0A2A9PLF4_OPHUN|nr:hypothetical protein XA68_15999 [Ophiocordyceps unilateralis]
MSSLAELRRPRVAAQNRKLRHLRGISLRNLCLSVESSDERLEAEKHLQVLHHLPSAEEAASPSAKQRHETRHFTLRQLVDASLGDVFFSLHLDDHVEPFYVSEMRQRSANFDFRFFDLTLQPPVVSRSSHVIVRVWSTTPDRPEWVFVLEHVVHLRRLNFIRSLVGRRFPPNALVFHLDDGLYSLDFAAEIADAKQAPAVASSSYGSLMKLANLEASIRDALETRDDLLSHIEAVLAQSPPDATDAAREDVARAEKYVAKQRRAIRQAESRRHQLRTSLAARRAAIVRGREAQASAEADMAARRDGLAADKTLLDRTADQIHGQRRRICSDLADIFPITPERDAAPLSFRICNLPLPNSRYDATTADEDVLSAALGLAALLARHLQLYLSYPLPYPLCPYGSRSLARDDISHLPDSSAQPRREFPLYLPRGGSTTGQWRFEYGWFLLNKDIEALCASQGLRVVDIRHSLPNLKYLLYVCSAGSRDLPERHRGGVKGLWAGSLRGMVRAVGSEDDATSAAHSSWDDALSDGKLTLRTDGLREDVAG